MTIYLYLFVVSLVYEEAHVYQPAQAMTIGNITAELTCELQHDIFLSEYNDCKIESTADEHAFRCLVLVM